MSPDQKYRLRHAAFQRSRGRCEYCSVQVSFKSGTIDHYMPRKLGGGNTHENVRWCCKSCNTAKGEMHPREWEKVRPRPTEADRFAKLSEAIQRERRKVVDPAPPR